MSTHVEIISHSSASSGNASSGVYSNALGVQNVQEDRFDGSVRRFCPEEIISRPRAPRPQLMTLRGPETLVPLRQGVIERRERVIGSYEDARNLRIIFIKNITKLPDDVVELILKISEVFEANAPLACSLRALPHVPLRTISYFIRPTIDDIELAMRRCLDSDHPNDLYNLGTLIYGLRADVNERNKMGSGKMLAAFKKKNPQSIKKAIQIAMGHSCPYEVTGRAIHWAVIFKDLSLLKTLTNRFFARKEDLIAYLNDDSFRLGRTPLHLAALYGEIEMVRYLTQMGAKVDSKDERGKTPIDLAKTDEIRNYLSSLI